MLHISKSNLLNEDNENALLVLLNRLILNKRVLIDGYYDGPWFIKIREEDFMETENGSINQGLSLAADEIQETEKNRDHFEHWFYERYNRGAEVDKYRKELIKKIDIKEDAYTGLYDDVLLFALSCGYMTIFPTTLPEEAPWKLGYCGSYYLNDLERQLFVDCKKDVFKNWFQEKYNNESAVLSQKNRQEFAQKVTAEMKRKEKTLTNASINHSWQMQPPSKHGTPIETLRNIVSRAVGSSNTK